MKNKDGESNIEVRERMIEFLNSILSEYSGKNIAVVSHGAAIKFLMNNWCKYNHNEDSFFYNEKFVCKQSLESPSVVKMSFEGTEIREIEKIDIKLYNDLISKFHRNLSVVIYYLEVILLCQY